MTSHVYSPLWEKWLLYIFHFPDSYCEHRPLSCLCLRHSGTSQSKNKDILWRRWAMHLKTSAYIVFEPYWYPARWCECQAWCHMRTLIFTSSTSYSNMCLDMICCRICWFIHTFLHSIIWPSNDNAGCTLISQSYRDQLYKNRSSGKTDSQ